MSFATNPTSFATIVSTTTALPIQQVKGKVTKVPTGGGAENPINELAHQLAIMTILEIRYPEPDVASKEGRISFRDLGECHLVPFTKYIEKEIRAIAGNAARPQLSVATQYQVRNAAIRAFYKNEPAFAGLNNDPSEIEISCNYIITHITHDHKYNLYVQLFDNLDCISNWPRELFLIIKGYFGMHHFRFYEPVREIFDAIPISPSQATDQIMTAAADPDNSIIKEYADSIHPEKFTLASWEQVLPRVRILWGHVAIRIIGETNGRLELTPYLAGRGKVNNRQNCCIDTTYSNLLIDLAGSHDYNISYDRFRLRIVDSSSVDKCRILWSENEEPEGNDSDAEVNPVVEEGY